MTNSADTMSYPSLKDRVVIITGGGRGLGYEMAMSLVGAGAKVAITSAREAGELKSVEEEAAETAGPGRLIALQADVRSYADCERVVADTLKRLGGLHCLVNNAGRGMGLIHPNYVEERPRFWEAPLEGWEEVVDTNLNGVFRMTRAAAPHMIAQGFGKIINVSTSDVTIVRVGYSPYGPTKAALEAMTRIWAQDLEGTGVTANVFLPGGATDTKILPVMANKRGADGGLLQPDIMRAPILWLCADQSNDHTSERYIARLWDDSLAPDDAATAMRDQHHEKPGIL
jgi:3-oxoacyl-[acyl-carrier protein] reductase